MRILAIQFASSLRGRPLPRFEPQLATLLALLKQRGHELTLLGMAKFDEAAVKAALARNLPQLIYADISPVCLNAARRTFQYIHGREFLPIVAGGMLTAVEPQLALSLPGVFAAAISEPDAALVTYLERIKDPATGQVVRGVWLRDESGLARPEMPELVEDLDSLPFAERDLFKTTAAMQRGGELELAVGRGCPQRCRYCPNSRLQAAHDGRGAWVRRRSPENVLEEIGELRTRYAGAARLRFLDHAFALDEAWLSEFLPHYKADVGLPFRCHLRANATDEQQIASLARAGLIQADIEIISASDFIRNDVFAMDLDADQMGVVFDRLRVNGVQTRGIVYVGCPYETPASLDRLCDLIKGMKPDLVDARPYFPWPGTESAGLVREQGWLHPRGEDQYHEEQSGMDMPAFRPPVVAETLARLRSEFPVQTGEPWWRRIARQSIDLMRGGLRRS